MDNYRDGMPELGGYFSSPMAIWVDNMQDHREEGYDISAFTGHSREVGLSREIGVDSPT
jgi:hypothetical protein